MLRTALALVLVCATTLASASPESDALKQQGLRALAEGRFAEAGAQFAAAMKADPRDAEAAYLHGAAANRQGQFPAAMDSLRKAEGAGFRDAELDFELGWAHMGQGQAQPCIERLERFEAARPGRGQASEFLGRCYLALRQFDQAESRLNQALARDPRLAPTVNLALASVEQGRGRSAAARARMESAFTADAPTGRALRDLAGPPEPVVQPDQPLRLSLSFSAGHNSNVIGLGNTMPLPADIQRKGSMFTRLSAGASYTHQVEPQTSLTLGYAFLSDRYEDIPGANLLDHFVYADLFTQVTARAAFSLRVSSEFTTLGGSRFRDSLGFRPAFSYRFGEHSVTEFAYSIADNDYRANVAPAFSRDGESQAWSVAHSFRIPGTNWSGAAGATYGRNRTEGGDFVSDSLGASGTLRYAFPNRIVGALGVGVSRDDYGNPNSLAGAGFAFARKDEQSNISAQLAGPFNRNLRWFLQAQSLRNTSNIAFYQYKQTTVTGGLAFDF
jgi:tetratricopeptide (TPR) repeat protein